MMEIVALIAIIVAIVAAIVAVILLAIRQARKHKEAMYALAAKHNWQLQEKDAQLVGELSKFRNFNRGFGRMASWVFRGERNGRSFLACQYTYKTRTTDSKGNTRTQHHHFSVASMEMPVRGHRLSITAENIFNKIRDALGGEDIDFESDDFSKKFWVKCDERRFAYDVITPAMMEFLLPHRRWSWQWIGHRIVLMRAGAPKAERIEEMVGLLDEFAELLPRHLVEASV